MLLQRQSQAQTSTRLAAQAASKATVSVTCTPSQEVWSIVLMAGETSGDSSLRVSTNIFGLIQDSFTTQWVAANRRVRDVSFCLSPHLRVNRPPRLKPYRIERVGVS